MKRPYLFSYGMLAVIGFVVAVCLSVTGQIRADQSEYRRIELPDLGSFEYPIATYSIQAVTPDISESRRREIFFPGVFSVSPNDEFLYSEQGRGHVVYTLLIGTVANTQHVTADVLSTQAGKLPLLSDDRVTTMKARSVTLDGLPAIRIDDIPVGATAKATYIIVYRGVTLIELLIKPTIRYGAPHHNEFADGDVQANRALIEQVISSLHFTK
jgi:hypothetical protein